MGLTLVELDPLDAREVTFIFSNPDAAIEPFRRMVKKPGDGTWRADGIVLPLPGEWTVRVNVLISDFDIRMDPHGHHPGVGALND